MQLNNNPFYETLLKQGQEIRSTSLSELILQENRETDFCFTSGPLWIDISRHYITLPILDNLRKLADAAQITQSFSALASGKPINKTENRPVLHTGLRQQERRTTDEWQNLASFSDKIRANKDIHTIINIGIGGSDLGPEMVTNALKPFHGAQKIRFVSNVDPADLNDTLADCDPKTTFFLVTSKTFTTAETLKNALLAARWLKQANINPSNHMAAITAAPHKAIEWGILEEYIFDFADGIGGRYSLWSAVGLPIMIAIGNQNFISFLEGANKIDEHVFNTPLHKNIPIILALLRIWNRNFLEIPMHGIMPYDQRLSRLPAWAQQLEMESNGKSVDIHNNRLDLPASPLIWGEPGTNAQHSFFQYLHQGIENQSLDFLIPRQALPCDLPDGWQESHNTLIYNGLAQAEALAFGETNTEEPYRNFAGGSVSTIISWDKTDPYNLGSLLALFEHITIASGFLWGVNSFDQWGVELGKKRAKELETPEGRSNFSPAAKRFLSMLDSKK
ncbi:MAG: glucose-6-phosphate isomerase [Alphaproteobacteria bacterium]|nr:glucose-6-phosphate isomerase [Alphaproteobacteria bacterium]